MGLGGLGDMMMQFNDNCDDDDDDVDEDDAHHNNISSQSPHQPTLTPLVCVLPF